MKRVFRFSFLLVCGLVIISVLGAIAMQITVVNKQKSQYERSTFSSQLWYGSYGLPLGVLQLVHTSLITVFIMMFFFRAPAIESSISNTVGFIKQKIEKMSSDVSTLVTRVTESAQDIATSAVGIQNNMDKFGNFGKSEVKKGVTSFISKLVKNGGDLKKYLKFVKNLTAPLEPSISSGS